MGGFFLPEVNVDLPVLAELTLAVHHHVVDHLSVEMIQIHKYIITEIQKYANPQILKYTGGQSPAIYTMDPSSLVTLVKKHSSVLGPTFR